jgi:DNA-binding transcriptional regulator GbsR (MarR family)
MTEIGLLERARKLGIDIKDTDSMLQAMERQADSLEAARNQISHILDELRMQTTLSKERVKWLTRELDSLQVQIRKSSPPTAAPA